MARKGLYIWILGTLTFVALMHFAEAVSVLLLNADIRLLRLYPLINDSLKAITPAAYFVASGLATVVLWGITCGIVFDNPVEAFLNKILSDAKKQTAVEAQMLEDKSEVLDAMYDTIASDNEILSQVKDLMCNVRSDVKEIQPMKEGLEKVRIELNGLKRELKKIELHTPPPTVCTSCGKSLLPDFKICPYCGERVKMLSSIISLKDYK